MLYLRCFLLAVIIILLPCFAEVTFACQCLPNPASCSNYSEANAVFVGTVIDVSIEPETNSRKVGFSVEESFRGVQGNEIELKNAMTSCEFTFVKGKKYFVYAYGDASKGFGTYLCSGTTEIADASEDLAFARSRKNGLIEQAIVGRIIEGDDESKPVAGIKVLVTGYGRNYNAFSDSEGRFKIVVNETGKYKVRLFLPKKSGVLGTSDQLEKISSIQATKKHNLVDYEVEVKAGECEYIYPPGLLIVRGKK